MRDLFISVLVSLAINLYIAYVSIKNGIPIYLDHDEVIWMKTLGFCGGEFAFYEQKHGLIVPVLCMLYPLKLIFQDFFLLSVRFSIVFLECFIFLKILRKVFKNEYVIISLVLAHFSYFVGIPASPFHLFSIIRIFSPSFFMIFFLIFYLFFIDFLDSDSSKRISKTFVGLSLGIVFYSSSYWILYLLSSVFIMILYLAFLKKRDVLKALIYILFIGFSVGVPAIVFNYFQLGFLKEGLSRGGYFVKGAGYKVSQEFYLFLIFFCFSAISFLASRVFSLKSLFIFFSSLAGLVLITLDLLSVLPFSMLLYHHLTFPFNFFNRILFGFALEKISGSIKVFGRFFLVIISIIFIFSWFRFFVFFFGENRSDELQDWAWEIIKVNVEHQRKIQRISEWIGVNTSEESVIVVEGHGSSVIKYDELFDELKVSVMTGRYLLHSVINFFSDMSDREVFERFLLREKLLGRKKEEIVDLYRFSAAFASWVGHTDLGFYFGKSFFGLPPGLDLSDYLKRARYQEFIRDFIKKVSELFSDEQYMSELMRKYRVDYVIRKRPPSEQYLKYIGMIEDLYISQFVYK